MNLEEFYEAMKKVLKYFDLDWHEKDQIEVAVAHNGVQFTHDGVSVVIITRSVDG